MTYSCPCCGFQTLEEKPPGTFEICPVCYWEDDDVQFDNPDFQGGANEVSLKKAQRNFVEFGASAKIFITSVKKPGKSDVKDRERKALE